MALLDDLRRRLDATEATALTAILARIEGPPNLFALSSVLSELTRLLPLLPESFRDKESDFLAAVTQALPRLSEAIYVLSSAAPFSTLAPPPAHRTDIMRPHIQGYPVYSMLPYRCKDPVYVAHHDLLKAHALAAALLLQHDPKSASLIRTGLAAVRWLRVEDATQQLPETPQDASAYCDEVHALLLKQCLKPDETNHTIEVWRLLECGIEGYGRLSHDWKTRRRRSSRTPSPPTPLDEPAEPRQPRARQETGAREDGTSAKRLAAAFQLRMEGDRDSFAHTATVVIERPSALSESELRTQLASGLAPSELGSDFELIRPDLEEPEISRATQILGKSVTQQAVTVKSKLTGIERSAQLLPGLWKRLAPGEVAFGLRELRRWIRAAQPKASDQADTVDDAHTNAFNREFQSEDLLTLDEEAGAVALPGPVAVAEAGALVATMLWLSKPLSDTLRLRFYASRHDAEREAQDLHIGYVKDKRLWVIPSIRPAHEPSYRGVDTTLARPIAPCLFLPDCAGAWRYFRRLASWSEATPGAPVDAITASSSQINAAADEFFERCSRATRNRLTATRWHDALFYAAVDHAGDIPVASALLNRAHSLSDTQLHYSHFNRATLVAIYKKVCHELTEAVLAELARADPQLPANDPRTADLMDEDHLQESAVGMGTPICPSHASVHRLVAGLEEACLAAATPATTVDELVAVHNAMTAYVCWLLRFAIGGRDSATPIPLRSDLDLEGGLSLLSDKDDASGFNSRVVPLPQVLVEQLSLYRQHRQTFASRLMSYAPSFAHDVIAGDQLHTAIDYIAHPASRLLRFAAIRNNRVVTMAASGTQTLRQLGKAFEWFQLPLNCNRHYLRSRLMEIGCSGVYLDHFMGHWSRGREPLARFGTLPLRAYLDDVRKRMEEILQADGWKALPGLR